MKKQDRGFLLFLAVLMLTGCSSSKLSTGKWNLQFNATEKTVTIKKDDQVVAEHLSAAYRLNDRLITTKEYSSGKASQAAFDDQQGKGRVFKIHYTGKDLPTLVQSFYVSPDKDYILTEFTLESTNELQSNYMAPVHVDRLPSIVTSDDNRALFVPFDNDKWVRFQSHPLTFDQLVSYEVSAIFNNTSRKGLVVGSIEHDHWKTAVEMESDKVGKLTTLRCYGGVANELTRDNKPHGALKGNKIKSPKVLIGFFDDWRTGMEAYADANATVAPPKPWTKAVPFGWNSWGVLQFNLTYDKAIEVSDFFRDHLQNNHFVNPDNTVVIGLDSGWNSFSEEQLMAFVRRCKENGQIAGVYWTPYTDWGRDPERVMNDAPDYRYKDAYLYANGQPQNLDNAYALDPTHPAVEARMKKTSDLFRRCGFEYVKMDFMTHGALEADQWHRPEITTGIQGYNYGMQLLNKYFGDLFINLSISPIFPAQYAQSRRIACDAWNKIKDTEYTMNAVSYGWWIDRVYQFNDADHIVLKDATEGENRARVTSSVITGLYIAGDDFSKDGPAEGKERAANYLTNSAINAMAKGVSFRPVEGNGEKSENQFIHTDETGTTYYVVFNYSDDQITVNPPLDRMGLNVSNPSTAKELWSGESVELKKPLVVPSKDVKVIQVNTGKPVGLD